MFPVRMLSSGLRPVVIEAAAPEWPVEYGGAGLNPEQAKVLKQEMTRLGCRPPLYCQGLWMLGPALLVYGNDAQKRVSDRHLSWRNPLGTRLLEPSAGSDLANLKTKAEDCGDHFLVSRTKIWTTKADEADWIFCLVHTSDVTPKQAGISFLLIDMATKGFDLAHPIDQRRVRVLPDIFRQCEST